MSLPMAATALSYADIINLQRPVHTDDVFSRRHPKMTLLHRAKIFAPFAALSGFDDHIRGKEVHYEPRREHDQGDIQRLGAILNWLHEKTATRRMAHESHIRVAVEYFSICTDPNNAAFGQMGTYITHEDIVSNVDLTGQTITVGDCTIPMQDIHRITILRAK